MIENKKGANVDEFRSRSDQEARQGELKKVLLPYAIMMASQLPLSLVYLKNIFLARPHYKLMPIAFLATALFLFLRWPRHGEPRFFPSIKSDVFWVLGAALAVGSAFLVSPWMSYAAFLCLFASLLARTNDRFIFGTLLPAIAPMVVLLQPPFAFDFDYCHGDISLIAFLDWHSAHLANDILDLLRYVHNYCGTSIELVSQRLDSTELGNGALSLFTLLIVTGMFIAWQRRPMFRATLLILAACFWFAVCEAFGLAICGISIESFESDLFSDGDENRVLQFGCLVTAALLTLLSDRLIAFLFGPVDISAIDEDIAYQDMVCRFWNNALAGVTSPVIDINVKKEVAWAKRRNSMPSRKTLSILWIAGMGSIALAVMQVQGFISANVANQSVFGVGESIQLAESSMPTTVADMDFDSHEPLTPERPTLFNANSNAWTYSFEGTDYRVTIRQPFLGWHDIDSKLLADDWHPYHDLEDYEFKLADGKDLHVKTGTYRDMLANFKLVYTCQLDGFARPFEKPITWSNPTLFIARMFRAIGNRSHPRMLDERNIELIVSVDTIGETPPKVADHCERLFREIAVQVHNQISERTLGGDSSTASDSNK